MAHFASKSSEPWPQPCQPPRAPPPLFLRSFRRSTQLDTRPVPKGSRSSSCPPGSLRFSPYRRIPPSTLTRYFSLTPSLFSRFSLNSCYLNIGLFPLSHGLFLLLGIISPSLSLPPLFLALFFAFAQPRVPLASPGLSRPRPKLLFPPRLGHPPLSPGLFPGPSLRLLPPLSAAPPLPGLFPPPFPSPTLPPPPRRHALYRLVLCPVTPDLFTPGADRIPLPPVLLGPPSFLPLLPRPRQFPARTLAQFCPPAIFHLPGPPFLLPVPPAPFRPPAPICPPTLPYLFLLLGFRVASAGKHGSKDGRAYMAIYMTLWIEG